MNSKAKALVVLAPGFEDIETVAPIDVLTRVGVQVVVAGTESGPIKAAYGTTIVPDCLVAEVSGDFDAIICPGGKANALSLAANSLVIELVRQYFSGGKLVAAICAAPSHVLGESAGILQGVRATGDPGFMEKLGCSGAIVCRDPVCLDRNVITASGPGSALSFALSIAAYLVGAEAVSTYSERWSVDFVVGGV